MRHDSTIAGTEHGWVAREDRLRVARDAIEQVAAGDHAVLDDLVQAGSELAPRQRRAAAADRSATSAGWWKAPIRFLPSAWLTPTLPPIELSTCASSVVGTCTSVMPRRKVAAAKPAVSPMTPPPTATMRAAAIGAGADQRLVDARDRLQVLEALAVGNEDRLAAAERALDLRRRGSARSTGLETTKRRAPTPMRVEQRRQPIDDAVADPDRRACEPGVDVDADGLVGRQCVEGRADADRSVGMRH